MRAKYFTFADDTVLVYSGTNELILNEEINIDLKKYNQWLYFNKLKINIDKTKFLLFKQKNKIVREMAIKMNDLVLERVASVRYLGLMVDDRLNWREHVTKLTEKILSMIPYIFKIRNYITDKTKRLVYNAFFLSHFRYLIIVWGMCGKGVFETVQIVQNKILKILFNFDRLTHTDTLYSTLQIARLSKILEFEQCKLMHKIMFGQLKTNSQFSVTNEIHNYPTRTQNNIYHIQNRTCIGTNNPFFKLSYVFNHLPIEIKDIVIYTLFIRKLKTYCNVE